MPYRLEFGEFCRNKRLERKLTLRRFCEKSGQDPAYISCIERGLKPPPQSESVRAKLATALGLQKNSEDWNLFHDLADLCAGRLPARIYDDKRMVELLPVFFRAVGKKDMSKEELGAFIEALRQELP
jgi:transcriptional regulator with XRE-family HTH domain